MSDIEFRKKAVRSEMRARLKAVSLADRAAASRAMTARLRDLSAVRRAFCILAFHPMPHEIDLVPFLKDTLDSGRRLVLPRVAGEGDLELLEVDDLAAQLESGSFGILEPARGMAPVPAKEIDVVVAPGIAFAADGRRLGQGGGFYDRLLARRDFAGKPVAGVGYDFQVFETVPSDARDVRVGWIVTDRRTIACGRIDTSLE